MICLNCNKEINDNSKFCEYCGSKVDNFSINNSNMMNNGIGLNMNDGQVVGENVASNSLNNNNLLSSNNNDFKTLEGVFNLFKSVNCIGQDNCIIVTYKDLNVHVTRTSVATGVFGLMGTAISSVAEDIERNNNENIISNNLNIDNFDGLILNKNEFGLGIIPIINNGSKMIPKLDNYTPDINRFIFVNNSYIQNISVKKLTMLSSKVQKITINIQGGVIFNLTANMAEKQIPYQNENMIKFVGMFGNK